MNSLPAIEAIETYEVRVPRRAANRITTSYATLPDAHHALVRVWGGGQSGVGEAPAERWWTGEDATSVVNAIGRYLAPALIGTSSAPKDAARLMDATLAANTYAKAAVEMALWDLCGRLVGLPLHALLGAGTAKPVPVKYVIGMLDPDRAREEASYGRSLGFRHLKVKVGGETEDDLKRIQAVQSAAGDGALVGLDANGGWPPTTALRMLEPLEALGASFIEQPVSAAFPRAMTELTARARVPIVAHESIFSVRDGFEAAHRRVAHAWALTPSTHGGLVNTQTLLGIAEAAGIPCLLGSTVELGIATAFLTQIGAAFPTFAECPVPSDLIGPLYHEGDVIDRQLTIRDGAIEVPDGPGLGVEIDDERVQEFRVDD